MGSNWSGSPGVGQFGGSAPVVFSRCGVAQQNAPNSHGMAVAAHAHHLGSGIVGVKNNVKR